MLLSSSTAVSQTGYDQHEKFDKFAKELRLEAGISKSQAKEWLSQAKKQESVLKAISRPAERVKPWNDYRNIFLTSKRIKWGRAFLKKHKDIFDKVEPEFGVSRYVIASIIGVETFYGSRQGSYLVLDSLSTLAFDYPKRPLFWRELKAFFTMAQEQGMDPTKIKGSYAGAMGYGQFIPSSYRHYAVDYDKDGVKDLWENKQDAIASVANYFKRHGWKTGQPVTFPVTVSGDKYSSVANISLKPKHTIAELEQHGVQLAKAQKKLDPTQKASLVELRIEKDDEESKEYWMGLHNYYVITRYNHSRMYALAVHQLSQELAAE